MCYPPPGPRCSSHANQEWLKALKVLDSEKDNNKRIRLQLKADEAFRTFAATPRGQNRLLREIGALENTPENQDDLAKLSLQLRDGKLARKNQMTAFLAMKNNKGNSIKELLQKTNKQEQAVGIAFHVLMGLLPEQEADNTHILTNNLIQVGSSKILCLPQKHQRLFGNIKIEEDGYLSSSDLPVEILDIFADFTEPNTITTNHIHTLMEWYIEDLKKQGITFLASVDVKTENIIFDKIDSLLDRYTVSFTQKKKLGGTSPYIHGNSELLKTTLQGTPLANCDVTVALVNERKRTYILDTPYLDSSEKISPFFCFKERLTSEGVRFHEVKTRHQSSQYEIMVNLSRKSLVISKNDDSAIRKFVFDNFPPLDSEELAEDKLSLNKSS